MAKLKLGLESLEKLGRGEIGAAFSQAIVQIIKDIVDRPGVKKKREVHLILSAEPPDSGEAEVDQVSIAFELKTNVPTKKSGTYVCGVTRTNELFFGGDANNPYQNTFDLGEDAQEET